MLLFQKKQYRTRKKNKGNSLPDNDINATLEDDDEHTYVYAEKGDTSKYPYINGYGNGYTNGYSDHGAPFPKSPQPGNETFETIWKNSLRLDPFMGLDVRNKLCHILYLYTILL